MTGVLDGIKVIDLSWGIAGPMATMLLADHGADVTKIVRPGGDPFHTFSGSRVWGRGKRSAVLDLKSAEGIDLLRRLASRADILVESFAPGTTDRLGIDAATLRSLNPRLIYCSITAYGASGRHADRPGLDALVAARTGHQWEHRGVVGGTIERISGGTGFLPGLEPPEPDCWVGPDRPGPLFGGVPWPSVATAYLTTLAISSAIRARERTGTGQTVSASLLQGVLATMIMPWQRTEQYGRPGYQSWIIDPRAPKGFFRAADGRWTHHWVPLPNFILGASATEPPFATRSEQAEWVASGPKQAPLRIGIDPEEMVLLHTFHAQMRDAVARLDSDEWVRLGGEFGAPVQAVRSPEEALLDPDFLADGCVTELDDPEIGPIRQVGQVYRLSACPTRPLTPTAVEGQHTDVVRAEAMAIPAPLPAPWEPSDVMAAPLQGVRVLDLGLAMAGPFGTQLLADLGADVIKVNTPQDGYWFGTHLAMCCNRGKRSIVLNLKHADGRAVFLRLLETADIVQHNMRNDAAERLGVDYETLRSVKPDLIYCQTRGFERSWRSSLPGNDQTGAALAGTEWVDGGLDNGGKPIWTVSSLGDTGNGFLSAIGMVQALYHRDRTGEGQYVDTSIVGAHLFNTSLAWIAADGSVVASRPHLDAQQLGWGALYRIYRASDGWLCIAVVDDATWTKLCTAIGRADLPVDPRFADRELRSRHDTELVVELETTFANRPAVDWYTALDSAGVPCEISDPTFVERLFDDPELIDRGWVTSYTQGLVGRMDVFGLLFDLSATPGTVQGPAPVLGAQTVEILAEAGYRPEEIADLIANGVAAIP